MVDAIKSGRPGASKQANNRGQFRKGKSGNPGGRPKSTGDLRKLAQTNTEAAVERLVFWMQSTNAKASVSACAALLDRGWGKPSQAITGEDGGPVKLAVEWLAPAA